MTNIIVFSQSLINIDRLLYIGNPISKDNKNYIMQIMFEKNNGIEFVYSSDEIREEEFSRLVNLIDGSFPKFTAHDKRYKKVAKKE